MPHIVAANNIDIGISIDFGIFSGNLSLTTNSTKSSSSISTETSLSGLNTLILPDNETQLLIELNTTSENINK